MRVSDKPSIFDQQERWIGDDGLVNRQIFVDREIYERELERVFARCWLFVGHESQVPSPGDYVTSYMGEDPVVVCRDAHGTLHVFLNSCLHRGMKICRTDSGNSTFFRCPYHAWTYSTSGQLIGVPFFKEGYFEELDRAKWGLHEAPHVQSYGGLIFACWDEGAMSLERYLGELRWYLDIVIQRPLGGLRLLSGAQRYVVYGNWKIAADNFAGDQYHVPYTHGSAFKLNARQSSSLRVPEEQQYNITFEQAHGIGGIALLDERYENDLRLAKTLGLEIVDYVKESHDRLERLLSKSQAKVFALGQGNVFPNFSFNDFSALRQVGFYLWNPKGPDRMELWQWCGVDDAAPQVVQDMARVDFSRGQSGAGFFGQDDSENFEQVTEATRGYIARQRDFNYGMGIGHEDELDYIEQPGAFSRHYTEYPQRNFYRYWSTLMKMA